MIRGAAPQFVRSGCDASQVCASAMQWCGWSRWIGTHLRGRCKRFSLLPAVPGLARTRCIGSVVLICRKIASSRGMEISTRQISASVPLAPVDEQMLEPAPETCFPGLPAGEAKKTSAERSFAPGCGGETPALEKSAIRAVGQGFKNY